MENFEKCAKRKRKKQFISLHCPILSVVVFPPLFLNLSLYVILDIPEVPAFKKRAQAKDGDFFGQKYEQNSSSCD